MIFFVKNIMTKIYILDILEGFKSTRFINAISLERDV